MKTKIGKLFNECQASSYNRTIVELVIRKSCRGGAVAEWHARSTANPRGPGLNLGGTRIFSWDLRVHLS